MRITGTGNDEEFMPPTAHHCGLRECSKKSFDLKALAILTEQPFPDPLMPEYPSINAIYSLSLFSTGLLYTISRRHRLHPSTLLLPLHRNLL